MKFKKIVLILIFLIVLSISSVSAEEILETNTVSALGVDDAVEVTSVGESSQYADNWVDLKAGVENENVSEILFNGTGVVPVSQIGFNHDLTIVGASGSYIGNSNTDNIASYGYVPFISNSNINVMLVNMTFRNMGDDILFQLGGNGYYTFENCVFENVNANASGKKSVIWFELGTGLVDNCTFTNCTTQFGTITNYHEGDVNAVHLTVKDSTFNNNYAVTSSGAINNCGQMTVINSTFNHNRAGWWAGAVHTHIGANTTIRKSRFINNVAGWNGGALYTYSTLTIIDSDFISNNCTTNSGGGAIGSLAYWGQTAPTMTIINCNFTNNINNNGAGNGGAIAFSGGTLNIYNTYFEGNDAKYGTAINAANLVNSNIVNNTFIRNTGVKNGTDTLLLIGSYNLENNTYSDDTPMTIDIDLKAEFTFGNNVDCNIKTTSIYTDYIKTASYEVFVDGVSYLNTTGNKFSVAVNDNNKHVVSIVLKGRNKPSNNVTIPLDAIYVSTTGTSTGDGSASNPFNNINDAIKAVNNDIYTIVVEEGTYYLTSSINANKNLNIIGQGNVVFDGRLLSGNNLFSLRTYDYSFKNITFMNFNNPIIYYGNRYTPNIELLNCTFKDNDISTYMIFAYSINVENSNFINNTVSNGILYLGKAGSTLNCTDSTFINNVASGNGAVFNGNNFVGAEFSGCLFVNNSANNGAVIYVSSSSANVNVGDCVFLNNAADDGNVITSNSPVVANNNWWGNTEYDYTIAPNVSSSVTVNNWLFLDENHNVVSDNVEHISLGLNNYNSASSIISNYEGSGLPDADMVVSINNGATSVSEITLKEGEASFNVYNLTINNYTVSINYYGDVYSFVFSFNGNKLYPFLTVRVKDMVVGGNARVVINMPVSVTGTVIISVNGVNTTVPIVNGLVSTQISTLNNLQEIVYNIVVTYAGDDNYYGASNSTFFMLCDDGAQWPMATFDSGNTGKVPYYGSTDLNSVKWYAEIGGNISNIVVDADGNVYVSNGSVIYAFNNEGVLLWNYSVIGYSNFTGLAISHDVIIATREGYGIYFINRFTGKDYSTANIWQGSSLFAPTVDEKGTIYISGEYQNDTGGYIVTIIPYSTWMFGDEITVVDIGNHSPIGSPICAYDGIVWINTVDGIIIVYDNGYVDDHLLGYDSYGFPVKSSNYDIVYDLFDGYLRLFDPSGFSLSGEPCNGHYLALDEDNNKIYVVGDYYIMTLDILGIYGLSNPSVVFTDNNYASILIDANGNIYGITDSNMLFLIDIPNHAEDSLDFNICGSMVMNSDGEILVCDEYGVLYCFANENYLSSLVSYDEPLLGISLSETDDDSMLDSLLKYSPEEILSDFIIDDSLDVYSWDYLVNYIVPFVSYDSYAFEILFDKDVDSYFDYSCDEESDYLTKEDVGDSIEIVLPKGHYIDDGYNFLIFPSAADTYYWNDVDGYWSLNEDYSIPVTYDGNNSIIDMNNNNRLMTYYHVDSDRDAANWGYNHNIVNTTLKNFIFCNLRSSGQSVPLVFYNSARNTFMDNKDFINLTFVNCTFVNCPRMFGRGIPNLHLINCTFVNCNGFGITDTAILYEMSLIWCNENTTIEGCKFIGGDGSALIVLTDVKNCSIENNYFYTNASYVILTKYDFINQFSSKNNYMVSNLNQYSFDKFFELHRDRIYHNFFCDGEIKYGNDAIYIFDDPKVGSFSLGHYNLEYNNIVNYPYKADVIPSIEGSNLVFTLNNSDNGNLTLDDGTVVKITEGMGSIPITAAPGDTVEGSISGYLGEKYYALGSDYSLTVPKLSPNLNITTDDLEFGYNNPIEIAIELESQTSREANVSIYDKDGKLVDSKLTKNTAAFADLAAGTYILNVTYCGDDTYLYESVVDTLTVKQATPELTLDVVNTTATLEIAISTKIDENIIININGAEYTLNRDNATLTLTGQSEGKYYVTAAYAGNENYTSVSRNKTVTLSRIDSNLKVNAEVENNIVTITSTLTPTTGTVTYILNNKQYTKSVGESLIIDDLTSGNYTVFASYAGDLMYNPSNDNVNFTIAEKTKFDPHLKLTVEDTIIKVSLNGTGDVIITVGDISFIRDATEDITINASEYLSSGNYDIKVTYAGNDVTMNATDYGSVTVPEEPVIEPKDSELKFVSFEENVAIISLNNEATGNVYLDVDGKGYYAEINDGRAVIEVAGLKSGNYTTNIRYDGDDTFKADTITVTISVSEDETPVENDTEPVAPEMTLNAVNSTITVTLNNDATGYVLVDVDGKGFYAKINNGKATVEVTGLNAGTYKASVTYLGDEKYLEAVKSLDVTIAGEDNPIENTTHADADAKVNVSEDAVAVTLPADAKGFVIVDVDGKAYYAPVKDGKVAIDLPELTPGNHTVNVIYTGDSKYQSTVATEVISIEKALETVISEDLIKIERASQRFGANFTDAKGNPLVGKNVTFEVAGVTYTKTTNANGRTTIPMNLVPGNYTVKITNPETGEVKTNNITILSRIVETHDVEMFYRNGSQYIVRVLDDNGNPVGAGEIVNFNINGITYDRKTNKDGYARINLGLAPGDYVVTAEYKGCKASNNIKVKNVLSASDLTKKFGTSDQFKVNLVDGQGKALAGVKVSFNINGVMYERTTNADGVAKMNIKLQAGQYIITSTYNGASISNTITVTA